jgi:hypothetical protein
VKVGIWCAVSAKIVGPVFFNEKIIWERYVQEILTELTEEKNYGWFQQYSATAHTARMSVQALSGDFGHRIIGSDIWLSRSSDRNPHDFFFWDCLKDNICNSNLSAEELKENVRRKIKNIPGEQLQKYIRTFSAGARNAYV